MLPPPAANALPAATRLIGAELLGLPSRDCASCMVA
jgi:hypothetical protein